MAKRRRPAPLAPAPPPDVSAPARATISTDPAYPAFMGTMSPDDPILAAKGNGRGWAIYDEILMDPRAFTVWTKRIRALQAHPWEVVPASEEALDQDAAAEVRRQFEDLGFDAMTEDLLDGIWKGFAVLEVIWAYDGARYLVARTQPIPQRRIRFEEDAEAGWRMRLLTKANPTKGEEVPARKFLRFTSGSKVNPYGLGLAARAWWPVFFKKQGIRFWLQFCDKYGSPTAVGKAPKNARKEQKEKLLAALARISQDAGVVIEEDEAISLLESASKSGSTQSFEGLARFMDEQLAEMVLGETGSTNQSGSGGSRARDQVGNSVRLEVAQADSDLLCDGPIRELARWITEANFPGARVPKVRRVIKPAADTKAQAERDEILDRMGWERTEDGFREAYGEGFQRKPAAPGRLPASVGPSFAEGGPMESLPAPLAGLGGTVQQMSGRVLDPLHQAAEKLLDDCASLSEFRERLPELAAVALPSLARLLEESSLAAQLLGRSEVSDGR